MPDDPADHPQPVLPADPPAPLLEYRSAATLADANWVTIAIFAHVADWYEARFRLAPRDVECRMADPSAGRYGDLFCDAPKGVALQVQRRHADRALQILRVMEDVPQLLRQHPDLAAQLAADFAHDATRMILAVSAIVHVDEAQFIELVSQSPSLPVVVAATGIFRRRLRYLASRHEMTFTTRARRPLAFPGDVRVIPARKIWIP